MSVDPMDLDDAARAVRAGCDPGKAAEDWRVNEEALRQRLVPVSTDVKPSETRPPVADSSMYYGLLGEIVHTAEPSTEADSVGVLASLMAGVGVLIGTLPYVQIGNTRHPLLIWPLLFGRTGSGRKGEAGETARVFLIEAAADFTSLAVTGLSSGEGLIERIRDRDPNNDKDTGGTADKRLLVTEPEFASVMARARREGSTLSAVLREAWAGNPLSVLNRTALKASSSHVSIVGHITPKEFRMRLAEADMAGGTFNRFLPVFVERSKKLPIPAGVDQGAAEGLAERLREAITRARCCRQIGLDDAATKLWTGALYDEFTAADDEDSAWTEFARRAAPYCRRIAALHAALDGRDNVSEADLNAAAALVRYAVGSAKYVLDGRRRDARVDRIMRALDGAGSRGLSRSDIRDLFSGHLSADALNELLAGLIANGVCEVKTVPTRGRPEMRYVGCAKSSESSQSP